MHYQLCVPGCVFVIVRRMQCYSILLLLWCAFNCMCIYCSVIMCGWYSTNRMRQTSLSYPVCMMSDTMCDTCFYSVLLLYNHVIELGVSTCALDCVDACPQPGNPIIKLKATIDRTRQRIIPHQPWLHTRHNDEAHHTTSITQRCVGRRQCCDITITTCMSSSCTIQNEVNINELTRTYANR